MKRWLVSAVAAAVALFVWGFVSHAVLGWQDAVWHGFADEAAVAEALGAQAPERGVYFLPSAEEEIRPDRLRAFVNVLPPGTGPGMGRQVGTGLLIQLVAALLVLGLLGRTGIRGFGGTVGFFTAVGLIVGFVSHAYYWNWFGFPTSYVAVTIVDTVVGWTLAGLAVGALAPFGEAGQAVARGSAARVSAP